MIVAVSNLANASGIALGVLLVVAGGAKIAAGPQWPAQAAQLGTPRAVAVVVPWLEIVVGVAVAARLAVPLPAIAAIVLLVAFSALLVARLRGDERPPCACFGAWSASPLSWWHVARNVGMLVLAVLTFFE